MTAAELVALARRVAHEEWSRAEDLGFPRGLILVVDADGVAGYEDVAYLDDIFRIPLTEENTASEDALVRALVASGVDAAKDDDGDWVAWMRGEPRPTHGPTFTAKTEYAARKALLDALLSPAKAR